MPFDNKEITDQSLSARALGAMIQARSQAQNPPNGNTGGALRQTQPVKGETDDQARASIAQMPQTTPPLEAGRASRAKRTSDPMAGFLEEWFFDWLTVTIPNGEDGKGRKRSGEAGEKEANEAADRLFAWATLEGLYTQRIGRGSDGYQGGAHLGFDPTDVDRVATIRAGHATNMPGLELPGAQGACARLAPKALEDLGPVLIARADVSLDVSQAGLFDEAEAFCREFAAERGMEQPRLDGTRERGRTLYFGKDEATLKIYEKGLEQLSKGRVDPADVDMDLVRFEFTFRPRKGRKAGLARVARDEGAGALLGSVYWVRAFAERIAVMTAAAREEDAVIGVTRVEETPDPRPIREKARHGARQYAGTFIKAAIADVVDAEFGGDWLAADLDPADLVERATEYARAEIDAVVFDVAENVGVDGVRKHEEEAERARGLLDRWLERQERETEQAQARLVAASRMALARYAERVAA